MADKSAIEWTDATWNPFRGCTRISPGCQNCYAERMYARNLPGLNSPTTGEPFAIMTSAGPRWTGKVELIENQMDAPLRWRKPRRIFVNSMSDTFSYDVPFEWVDRIVAVASYAYDHTYLLLTKRALRMKVYFDENGRYRNLHLGVSCEDQQRFDERTFHLQRTLAYFRWLSLEPLLGPIDLAGRLDGIHWVVVGGESGPGARPVHPDWVRSIRDACVKAGVPFFFKQWGEYLPPMTDGAITARGQVLNCSDVAVRAGKKRAGALLDGREWNELPEAANG